MGLGEYCIIADGHLNAPHQAIDLKEIYKLRALYGKRCILVGDIYDISNTPKKKLEEAKTARDKLSFYFGKRYIWGNHECGKPPHGYYLIINGVLFCHGHTIFWSDEKVKRWEKKKGGRGKLSMFFYRMKHWKKRGRDRKLKMSEEKKERCLELMNEHDCHTIVFGHTHRNMDEVYKGKRIIGVPQGKTIVRI